MKAAHITIVCKACLFLWIALAASSSGLGQTTTVPTGNDLIPDVPVYVIQPNDLLEVFVWKEPELSRKVLVRPDGRISVPLVQDIQAAGLTAVELKDSIQESLLTYIASPNVTVIVDAIQSYKIFVIGKVQKPGSLVVEKPVSVLQALALAGGFQEYANESEITVIRTYGTEHVVFDFNYKEVVKGKKTAQNIILRSGDVVVVP